MRRRNLLFGAGGALGAILMRRQLEAAPDRIPSFFRLFAPASRTQIQDVVTRGEIFTYLAHTFPGNDFFIGAVSFDGTSLWRHSLPRAFYLTIGFGSDGSILLYSLGGDGIPPHSFVRLRSENGPVEVIGRVRPGPKFWFVDDGVFIRPQEGGSVEIVDVGATAPPVARVVAVPTLRDGSYSCESISVNEVVLVDEERGSFIHIGLPDGVTSENRIDDARISNALSTHDDWRRSMPSGEHFHPSVIAAHGMSQGGTIYCLLSPWATNGRASVIEAAPNGSVRRSGSVLLPDLRMPGYSVPSHLVELRGGLGIVFAQGGVIAYPEAWNGDRGSI